MAGFVADAAKRRGQQSKARDRLGIGGSSAGPQTRTPPINPTGPGQGEPAAPPQAPPPPEGAPAPAAQPAPLAGPLGPVAPDMQARIETILRDANRMVTQDIQRLGPPGATNQLRSFYTLYGRMPTPRELTGFRTRVALERDLGRPPTAQEVRQRLASSDALVRRTPEPFA